MIPVVVYPKKYVDDLLNELNEIKAKIASGDQPIFDNVEDLFEKLEEN